MLTESHGRRAHFVFDLFCRAQGWLKIAGGLLALAGLLAGPSCAAGGETSLREYQVKALFLLNFAKYVDWPPGAPEQTNAPIVIGVMGENKFGDDLHQAVDGKRINGREIVVRQVEPDADGAGCQILFISASESRRLGDILNRVNALPVLTVGEDEQFTQKGGIINFIKKEGKIRLEINADAGRRSKLRLSSKLLSVADVVRGKT